MVGNPPRDKVGACYEQIMTDLTRAYDMLTVAAPDLAADNKATNSTAYISQAAVDALRARVSLYHKKYTHAYIYASNALRAVGIAKLGEVQNLWLDKSNAGTISSCRVPQARRRSGRSSWAATIRAFSARATNCAPSFPKRRPRAGFLRIRP